MKKEHKSETALLRQKAEELMKNKSSKSGKQLSAIETQKLIHELEVHQIELELQNEELIQAKEQASIAAEKYFELYDLAPSGYFTISAEGEILELNLSGAKMLGRNRSQLKNRLFHLFIAHDSKPFFLLFLEKVLNSNTKESCELTMLNDANPQLILHLTGRACENSANCFITTVDITDRKQAEEALKESEARYRTSFENSRDAIDIFSKDKNILAVNNELLTLSGYSKKELLLMKLTDLFPETQSSASNERIAKLLRGEKNSPFEIHLKTKHGKQIPVETSVTTLYNCYGHAVVFQGNIRDISLRKQAEESILKLSHAVEQSPVSILITDKNGNIEYGNPKVAEITGYPMDELIGRNPRIFKSGETSKSEYKILWDTISSGKEWFGEFHNKKKNGELYWEYASLSPIMNEKEEITHYVAVKEDITARKLAEIELIKAKEKAEESDRLKTAFLANMSHEIRTPMNSIMGFASLLPEEESKELMTNYTSLIVSSSEHLLHIIDDIVLYSKLQTKLISYSPTQFNVQKMLYDIKQSFNLPEFHKGVELKIETEIDEPVFINSDTDKLRQIFLNLISNAFKYTNSGAITIGFNKQKDEIICFVKDTGIGIPKNELEKVFERFFRGSNVNKGVIGGTGLGLSIVKELMQLLDGKIWVENNSGLGSTFYFTIPYNS